jgi:hypothetical protein
MATHLGAKRRRGRGGGRLKWETIEEGVDECERSKEGFVLFIIGESRGKAKWRRWLVRTIRKLRGRMRTRRRKADQEYLKFAKTKRKTKKVIAKAKKAMLQYVRRNLKRLGQVLHHAGDVGDMIFIGAAEGPAEYFS